MQALSIHHVHYTGHSLYYYIIQQLRLFFTSYAVILSSMQCYGVVFTLFIDTRLCSDNGWAYSRIQQSRIEDSLMKYHAWGRYF